jgi:RNA polymerase sigma-70 factor (ECF subfamily)
MEDEMTDPVSIADGQLSRLHTVLTQRQEAEPDPARQVVLYALRELSELRAASAPSARMGELTAKVLAYLIQIDSTSLGTPTAKTLRNHSNTTQVAAAVARAIDRDELPHLAARSQQHLLTTAVIAYIEGTLSKTAHAAATEHVRRCSLCWAELQIQRESRLVVVNAVRQDSSASVRGLDDQNLLGGFGARLVEDVEQRAETAPAGALVIPLHKERRPAEPQAAPEAVRPTRYTPRDEQFEQLVGAAATRDRVATQQVLESIRPVVLRYCRARVGRLDRSFAVADDVVQEVCLSVLSELPSYRAEQQPFLAFVYGISQHKVAEALRTIAHRRSLEAPVLGDELKASMDKLLAVLSDKQREVVVLRVVVGLSAAETADLVGSTPGAVRMAQQRALTRLRKLVGSTKEF